MLLSPPGRVPFAELGDPLPPPRPLPSRRQPCLQIGEPLVPISGMPILDAYHELGILPPRPAILRAGAWDLLKLARSQLKPPFDLVLLDGTRTLSEQLSLVEFYGAKSSESGYVAAVDHQSIRPPHVTGGALDITLSWEGVPLALGTDFDDFSDAARLHAFEHQPGAIRELRRGLASCLGSVGFTSYELEWWHWSYGDDVWGFANRRPSLYGLPNEEADGESVPIH